MSDPPIPEAVRYLAARYEPRCLLSLQELTEAGMAGYRRAQAKFDPSRGTDFAEHAYWWVKQAIAKAIIDQQGLTVGDA